MQNKKKEWDEVGYIISSKIRLKILINIAHGASTPSKISAKLGEPTSQISTALRELLKIGAVECLTPERRKGKLYIATEKGRKILNEIHEMTDILR